MGSGPLYTERVYSRTLCAIPPSGLERCSGCVCRRPVGWLAGEQCALLRQDLFGALAYTRGAFGEGRKVCDRYPEAVRKCARLLPGGVACAPLDARYVRRVHIGGERPVFARQLAFAAQPPDRATEIGAARRAEWWRVVALVRLGMVELS